MSIMNLPPDHHESRTPARDRDPPPAGRGTRPPSEGETCRGGVLAGLQLVGHRSVRAVVVAAAIAVHELSVLGRAPNPRALSPASAAVEVGASARVVLADAASGWIL